MSSIIDSLTGNSVNAFQLTRNIHGFAQFWLPNDEIVWAQYWPEFGFVYN